jgi:hypothetical protein
MIELSTDSWRRLQLHAKVVGRVALRRATVPEPTMVTLRQLEALQSIVQLGSAFIETAHRFLVLA